MTKYHANGVFIRPSSRSSCHVTYTGLLKECGADAVYAHTGYGHQWKNAYDYKMEKTAQGFEAAIPIPSETDRLNLCFKDSANNWDNNSGRNYSLLLTPSGENRSLELAEEISTWDSLTERCRANVALCKTAFDRWLNMKEE